MTLLLALALLRGVPPDSAPRAAILGKWNGTSTCVDRARNPSCNDEVVIYEFSEKPGDPNGVLLNADKVVDGKVLPMGELDCRWDAALGAWIADFQNSRVHIVWSFVVKGDAIDGTLVSLPGKEIVRKAAVKRQ